MMLDVGFDVLDFVLSYFLWVLKGYYIELNFILEILYVGICGVD